MKYLLLFAILGLSLSGTHVRKAAVSGRWYPDNPSELRKVIHSCLDGASSVTPGDDIHAIIVPHAGYTFSASTAGYAFRAASRGTYRRIVLFGTSHHSRHEGMSVGDYRELETPLGNIRVDRKVVTDLLKHPLFSFVSSAHDREHSLEAQLPFIRELFPDTPVVTLIPGPGMTIQDLARAASVLRPVLEDNSLAVFSTDFTHYGPNFRYVPFRDRIPDNLNGLDMGAFDMLKMKDPHDFQLYVETTGATICGYKGLELMMLLYPGDTLKLLNYSTSGQMLKDYNNSVSYVAAALTGKPAGREIPDSAPLKGTLSKSEQTYLLQLARATLHSHLFGSRNLADLLSACPEGGHLHQVSGLFVTLNKKGNLRGCIGTIEGTRPIYQGVVDRAVAAAAHDRRFNPVEPHEYDDQDLEISILSPPEVVESYREIKLGHHGVILEKNGRGAVYLPQVATETGWDLDTFLTHLSRKAGLSGDAWKKDTVFRVFTAQVFHEEEKP